MAYKASKVFGIIFIVIGVLGFFNNPVLGLFEVDTAHNIVHIVLGLILLLAAGVNALRVVAVIYLVVAILGFAMGEGELLGLVHVNQADNWLHIVLAVALFACSMCKSNRMESMSAGPSPMV
jgi:hypothetical protein